MPSSIFSEYMEYYAMSPFGSQRDNVHAGLIAATIANVNRNKSQQPFSADDFMLKQRPGKTQDTHAELFSVLSRYAVKKDV